MKKGANAESVNKDLKRNHLGFSDPKQWDEFSILVGMIPYRQLGTGARCKGKKCGQPVYDKKSGLCSYHRMEEAERAFEDSLRARQQKTVGEG